MAHVQAVLNRSAEVCSNGVGAIEFFLYIHGARRMKGESELRSSISSNTTIQAKHVSLCG